MKGNRNKENDQKGQKRAPEQPAEIAYEIRIKGHLSEEWSQWFDGLTITNFDNGEGLLAGVMVDQAALQGILARIGDLNLTLISVNPVIRRR